MGDKEAVPEHRQVHPREDRLSFIEHLLHARDSVLTPDQLGSPTEALLPRIHPISSNPIN